MSPNFDFLKEASQITGVDWAALVERESGHWQVRAAQVDSYLCGALGDGDSH